MTVELPDVSEFQTGSSAPNWAGIKKQNGGAGICRVGYGAAHLDHMFVSNYTELKKNKYAFIGLYHYIIASVDAATQAAQFCKWVGPATAIAPGTVFILDLEEGTGNQLSRANAWLNHVDTFYGLNAKPLNMRSWLYSGQNFAVTTGLSPIFHSARHTWVAAYQASESGLLPHTMWQSTNGSLGTNIITWSGCGRCDTSIYHGDLPQLAAMGWPGHTTPPADPKFHGEYTTAGMFSLAQVSEKLGYPTNTVLRMTAVHYGMFPGALGPWVHDVMTGAKPPTTPLPAGTKLWCD